MNIVMIHFKTPRRKLRQQLFYQIVATNRELMINSNIQGFQKEKKNI